MDAASFVEFDYENRRRRRPPRSSTGRRLAYNESYWLTARGCSEMTGDDPESGGEDLDRDDLESIVAENPEAVATFIDRLDAVNEFLDVVVALGEGALTDEMVVELAGTASTLAESADGLATDETVALAETVGGNGADSRGDGDADRASAKRDAGRARGRSRKWDRSQPPRSTTRWSARWPERAPRSARWRTHRRGRRHPRWAERRCWRGRRRPTERSGISGRTWARAGIRDPEVQYGLGYVLAISKAIGRERAETDDDV